jgi:hypothetical protein
VQVGTLANAPPLHAIVPTAAVDPVAQVTVQEAPFAISVSLPQTPPASAFATPVGTAHGSGVQVGTLANVPAVHVIVPASAVDPVAQVTVQSEPLAISVSVPQTPPEAAFATPDGTVHGSALQTGVPANDPPLHTICCSAPDAPPLPVYPVAQLM